MCIEHAKVFGTPGLLQMHRTNASNNMLVVCMYYQPTQWHSTFTSKFFILLQLTDRLFICCLMVTAIPMLPSTWSTFYVLAAGSEWSFLTSHRRESTEAGDVSSALLSCTTLDVRFPKQYECGHNFTITFSSLSKQPSHCHFIKCL